MKLSKTKKRQVFILLILTVLLIILNYNFVDKGLENFFDASENAVVVRIIDGDTIETEDKTVRLLGINTPERGERYYEEAKDFLNNLIFNKTIRLEFTNDRYDKYGRVLAYVFLENKNMNIELVENGFANYYFYSGRDEHSNALEDAWMKCIESNKNLCEVSINKCTKCINIGENYITNTCTFSCDISGWIIKGEGREKVVFNETLEPNELAGFDLDTTNSGGSLFLRDEENKLVNWK